MEFCFNKIKENNWKARWIVDDSNARDVYLYLLIESKKYIQFSKVKSM